MSSSEKVSRHEEVNSEGEVSLVEKVSSPEEMKIWQVEYQVLTTNVVKVKRDGKYYRIYEPCITYVRAADKAGALMLVGMKAKNHLSDRDFRPWRVIEVTEEVVNKLDAEGLLHF
jgi:hypothetical protein